MNIREATESDFDAVWLIFNEIISAGETYAYPKETTKSEAQKIWMQVPSSWLVKHRRSVLHALVSMIAAGFLVLFAETMTSSRCWFVFLAATMVAWPIWAY